MSTQSARSGGFKSFVFLRLLSRAWNMFWNRITNYVECTEQRCDVLAHMYVAGSTDVDMFTSTN